MKFSEKWLREFIDPKIDTTELSHQLTMAGLEVDSIEPAYPYKFKGLVVAKVQSVSKHPHSDKLHICKVDCGDKTLLDIVCGAPNLKEGIYTVLAKIGAKLHGRPQLKAISSKGVQSHGMLCSAKEIGLGEEGDGIIELSAKDHLGQLLNNIIDFNDNIIEISLTPNRGDCLNINGIAREVAIINQLDYQKVKVDSVAVSSKSSRKIKLTAKEACPRYVGRVIENVDLTVGPPLWLTEKLRLSGIRSINVVVDISNYVMIELGQPLHAFDNDRLCGAIDVRYSEDNEKIKLLDGTEHIIKSETLLISDQNGPLAIAGLMGGFDSAVTTVSSNIFLESAFFNPVAIIGEACQYGLHTDSSHRFERGVDPELQRIAIERASQLILELCGGQAGTINEVVHESELPRNTEIVLRKAQLRRVLGTELDETFVKTTLERLGMKCKVVSNQLVIKKPSYRFDIKIEVDLIEELARIYRYDAIPAIFPSNALRLRPLNSSLQTIGQLQEILINRGYQEVITYSFIDPKLNNLLKNKDKAIVLANPIAPELSEMRTSLLSGLLNSLKYNLRRQTEQVRLFETGLVFKACEEFSQTHCIAGLIYGKKYEKQWPIDYSTSNFYNFKLDVEAILSSTVGKKKFVLKSVKLDFLHPEQSVEIILDGKVAGYFGQLHPRIGISLDILGDIYVFEIKTKNIINRVIQYQPISRFPAIKRDLSILCDELVSYQDIADCIGKAGTALLSNLELFDVYQGKGIEKGEKSLTFGLTFQATSSTLKDNEIKTIVRDIVNGLHNKFGARLRQ